MRQAGAIPRIRPQQATTWPVSLFAEGALMIVDDLDLELALDRGHGPHSFVDVGHAARVLGVSQSTIRRRCRLGQLLAIRFGREWRIEMGAIHYPAGLRHRKQLTHT